MMLHSATIVRGITPHREGPVAAVHLTVVHDLNYEGLHILLPAELPVRLAIVQICQTPHIDVLSP